MMKHKGTVRIETERLILRRFEMSDAEAALANWMNDARVTEFLTWEPHGTVEVTSRVLAMWIERYSDLKFYQWAIELKEIGEPIGSISVVDIGESANRVQIGYCIGSRFWRHGYTSEALAAIIPFLFEEVRAQRIEAKHAVENPNSGKVMQRCGLTYEGTMRQAAWCNKGIVDVMMYSLLRDEWRARKLPRAKG